MSGTPKSCGSVRLQQTVTVSQNPICMLQKASVASKTYGETF